MTAFDHFSPAALTFLQALKTNNRRDWFQQHKPTYEAEIKRPAQQFGTAMSAALDALTGTPHAARIYRIQRDMRFSKDKTPYTARLHISFSPQPVHPNAPMWFFGLTCESLALGCGVMQFDKAGLAEFRAAMDGARGAALIALTKAITDQGHRVDPPELKRVPPGFDPAHAHADALRRKGLTVWRDLKDPGFVTSPDLIPRIIKAFDPLLPVAKFLSELNDDLTTLP